MESRKANEDADPPPGWTHPHLRVGPSSIAGLGVFATSRIAAGEVIARLTGREVSTAQFRELLKDPPVDAITLDDDRHLVLPRKPRPLIAYGNHSCEPNTWWADAVTLVARTDIEAGDEVTNDYATSTGIDYELECRCGSALCRGTITGEDWRLPELQERYGEHWVPVLRRRQQRDARPPRG
jgi:uncharacterized protein